MDVTPAMKRNLGLALVTVCSITTAGWAWTSYQAADMVGSPYVWAIVLVGYFTGVTLIGASWPVAIDQAASRRIRMRLVLYFMAIGAVVGFLFLLIHLAIGGHPPAIGQKYAPWTLLASLVTYVPFYYYKVHRAKLKGIGTLLVPMIYLIGQTFFPFAMIDYYNQASQQVETINSIYDLPSAKSSFVAIKKLEINPRYALDYNYQFVESDGQRKVVYTGLLPVNTGRTDTLFNVWLLFDEKDYYSKNLEENVVNEKERNFFSQNRNRMLAFQPDSAVFYDHRKLDNREVLRKHNYPLTEEAIVLIPVSTNLESYIGSSSSNFIVMISLLVVFFWIASAIAWGDK